MAVRTRYKESRVLVRPMRRLPGEAAEAFREKVKRVRAHFEQFNTDVSELCQWMMGLRKRKGEKDRPEWFGELGEYLLEPTIKAQEDEEGARDRARLRVFDDVAGIREADEADVPGELREAMEEASAALGTEQVKNKSLARMMARIKKKSPAHRLVLLKSAAEWIVARYKRGAENWRRQREEWNKEREAWEKKHTALTAEVREQFTNVYEAMSDPEREGETGLRRKNPRICVHERLKQNIDNCCYAGEKGHGPLCWKYAGFIKAQGQAKKTNAGPAKQQGGGAIRGGQQVKGWGKPQGSGDGTFNAQWFFEAANKLLAFCGGKNVRPSRAFLSPNLGGEVFRGKPDQARRQLVNQLKSWWATYLKHMEINEETIMGRKELPHCHKIGGKVFENSQCRWNPHTELCLEYKQRLGAAGLSEAVLNLEAEYREWRKQYWRGPKKPSFEYPSTAKIPTPKIFGRGFFELDIERSVVRLRLDDMGEGEWVEMGIKAWPRTYMPRRKEVGGLVRSVQVNFVGSRGRIGLRFGAVHKESRVKCSQEELDELRSRVYPRAAQDEQFLEAARKRIVESFAGNAEQAMRVLAVDVGESAAVAVYEGKNRVKDEALKIVKIDTLYSEVPEGMKEAKEGDEAEGEAGREHLGLRKGHVERHLKRIGEGAKAIAEHRQARGAKTSTLGVHDLRNMKRHVGWMIRDWVRLNAKQIMEVAKRERCDVIVFESRRGIRLPGYEVMLKDGREAAAEKRRLGTFEFGKVRWKVTEKAVEAGMRVVTAPFRNSSQVCSACGKRQENKGRWRKNKMGEKKFECEHKGCGLSIGSDANAARVMGRVFWGEIRLAVEDERKPAAQLTGAGGGG